MRGNRNNPVGDDIKAAVREVLRAELIDYLQTATVRPAQVATTNDDGVAMPAGYSLKIDTDGVARFLP